MTRFSAGLGLALLTILATLPAASAEFGPESADGYPINVDGQVLRPPVTGFATRDYPVEIAVAYGLLPAELLEADAAGQPLNKAGPLTFYPYYPLLVAELTRLTMDHPDLVKLHSFGTSTAGLDLWMLEIADFARIEAGEGLPLDEREVAYIDGGTHSNEYSGVYFVTELAQFLLDEYDSNDTAQWIVENRHTWILPMVNPDGSHAFGRLNANGVNINRNFPGTYGTVDEDPILNNPGPEAASELETQTVLRILDELQPDYVNSIHCCGNLWLHPYGAEQLPTPDDITMYTRICDEVFYDVREDCGEIWSTIYPASGTTADEGYERVGASSWTYEMSGRANKVGIWGEPTSEQDVREQERESWRGVLHGLVNLHKYGARPEIVALSGDASTLNVTVANIGYGNVTFANLTLGEQTQAIPPLRPNETATLSFDGAFAPGDVTLALDWEKRVHLGPQGVRFIGAELVREAGGTLRGVLDADALSQANVPTTPADVAVPAPGLPLLLVGLVVAAIALQRRRS